MQDQIYCGQVQYGQGGDGNIINPEQMGWKLKYSDRIPGTIRPIEMSVIQALQESDLQTLVLKVASNSSGVPARLINRLQNGGRGVSEIAN